MHSLESGPEFYYRVGRSSSFSPARGGHARNDWRLQASCAAHADRINALASVAGAESALASEKNTHGFLAEILVSTPITL